MLGILNGVASEFPAREKSRNLVAQFQFAKREGAFKTLRMTLGFIGCGRMASALVEGVVKAGVFEAADIFASDRYDTAANALKEKTGVRICATNREVAEAAETLLLCVKPTDVPGALREIAGDKSQLIISIAAGITLEALQEHAGQGTRVVRVMPNTPALIHQGAAAYALGQNATKADAVLTEKIFAAVGTVAPVPEAMLDAVTGLSGSGPAYIYVVIEALADAGVAMGLPRELALQLAAQTTAGAAGMVLQTKAQPAELKDMVASPGGTTVAGLEALENAGVRSAILSAVRAATERSRELGAGKKS
ncbi:MAG: pyrroline-5-carboxylate reductase [Chthoniobacter sp.]|jgi:pyrroline-5-carboxylate reductase|nr:pyrroline-5-carboxylate reductase [Chthoniobacter sp.]